MRRLFASGALAAAALAVAAPAASADKMVGTTTEDGDQDLIVFDTERLRSVDNLEIKGLGRFEITGLDVRPATGVLYADAENGGKRQLFTLTLQRRDGDDRVIAEPLGPDDGTDGRAFGFAVNPVPDRIRLVDDRDDNRRYNPNDGARADNPPDGRLVFGDGDPFDGRNPADTHVAYTNQQRPGEEAPSSTTLYGIDTDRDVLVEHDPPNSGTLVTEGRLRENVGKVGGFDITIRQKAFAALLRSGADNSRLYQIDLDTGRARSKGVIKVENEVESLAEAPSGF